MNNSFAICVTNLSKQFDNTFAVSQLSFQVPYGKTVALLGGNGAGKTTTLAMLLGLLIPTSGEIEILGFDILRDRYRVLAEMNFTSPYVDLPHRLSVREILYVYGKLYAVGDLKRRIGELAVQFNLGELLKRKYGSLSAGQRTRVSFAKALLNHPKVLIMDEPTASLDPDTADQVRTYLSEYQVKHNATVLLASHNMQEVQRLADDCLVLKQGHLVAHGSPETLLEKYGREDLEQVFLAISRNTQD